MVLNDIALMCLDQGSFFEDLQLFEGFRFATANKRIQRDQNHIENFEIRSEADRNVL